MAFLAIPAVASFLGGGTLGTGLAAALSGSVVGGAGAAATGHDWKKGALLGAGGAGLGALMGGALGAGGAGAEAAVPIGTDVGEGMVAGQSLAATEAAGAGAGAGSSGLGSTVSGFLGDTAKETAKQAAVQEAMKQTQPSVTTTTYAPALQWLDTPQMQWGQMIR